MRKIFIVLIIVFISFTTIGFLENARSEDVNVEAKAVAVDADPYQVCAENVVLSQINKSRDYSDLQVTSVVESWWNSPAKYFSNQDWYVFTAHDDDGNWFTGYALIGFSNPRNNPRTGELDPAEKGKVYCRLTQNCNSFSKHADFIIINRVDEIIYSKDASGFCRDNDEY